MNPGPTQHVEEMVAGIAACREGRWREGHDILTRVALHEDSDNPFPGYFYSYLGVAMSRAEGRKREGVELARYGVELEPRDPENRLNLARAYLLVRNRRRAVKQLNIGLRVSPKHSGLRALREKIGYRRRPFIPFLSRDFFLNQWMGRLTWRKERQRKEQEAIEAEERELERLAAE